MSAPVRGAQPQVSRDLPDVPRDSLGHVRLYAVPRRGQPSSCPPPQPLLMKVMACLRRMAFGISFDGLEDMCGISKSRTLHSFCPVWEQWFLINNYYDEWVRLPDNVADEIVELFRHCGLPGCMSSMDLVHVRYDRCPAAQRPRLHTGKGDFPTMGYRQFHTGHNRYIFQVSDPGAGTDETIERFDDFLNDLVQNPEYARFPYKMKTGNVSTFFVACGDLCDGGYHKWLHAICGAKDADNLDLHAWSGPCESTRKDVECVLGSPKMRFRPRRCLSGSLCT